MNKEISSDKLKMLQQSILDEVDSFCQTHNIQYFLYAGTLLGAVRHKGYIPWDDDIDICMKRLDYNRFFAEFNMRRNDVFRSICSSDYPGYYLPYGKVMRSDTYLLEHTRNAVPIGVNIDVFPLDQFPDDEAERKKAIHAVHSYDRKMLLTGMEDRPDRAFHKKLVLHLARLYYKMTGFRVADAVRKQEHMMTQYNVLNHTEMVADFAFLSSALDTVFPRNLFNKITKVEFEGKEYWAPADYDAVLTRAYGDYMQLPPVEQRMPHHSFDAYMKN